jgi:hypothetical protein
MNAVEIMESVYRLTIPEEVFCLSALCVRP